MATYADGSVIISIDADGKLAIKELEKTKEQVEDVGKSSEDSSASMLALSAGAAAASAALIALGAAAVNCAMDFDAAFAKTATIMDSTQVSVQDMQSDIIELSNESAMAATNLSEAVYQAISGSVVTADAAAFVSDANKLATAGFTSLTNATDVLTTTLNAYGLSADSVTGISNVLIQTQNLGKTSVDELSASIGKAISTGSAYGVNLENLSAAYVELTRGGIATAEATTYLSGMLNELGKADSDVATIIREQTGKTFGEMMASGASLADVLGILSDTVDGNAEALMGLWGSQEAGKAANAIMTQGVDDFNGVLGQMQKEMSGATDTTEAAYATMTNTSQFIDGKLKNSVNNLGIAFGDKLSPAVDGIKKGLTWLIDGFANFVREHPAISAAITGVAVGLGVAAVALGVYAIGAKAAESATLKLTLAMATNPIFLAITAIAALTAGIAVLATSSNDTDAELQAINESAERIGTTLDDAASTRAQAIEDTEAAAGAAEMYIIKLEELETSGLKTKEQHQEWHNTLLLLTQTVPELADKINLETDSIDGGTAALRENMEAWKNNAIQQAYLGELTTAYTGLATAQLNAEKAGIKLTDAQTRLSAAEADKSAVSKRMAEISSEAYANHGNAAAELILNSNQEYQALKKQYRDLETTIYDTEQEISACTDTVDAQNVAIAEAQNAVDMAEAAMNNLTSTTEKNTDGTKESTDKAERFASVVMSGASDFKTAASTLEEAYATAKIAAWDSLNSQIGAFERMDDVVAVSVSDIISNLDSQVQYMETYNANLAEAARLGVSEGLLKALSDGSAESAAILQGIVEDGGKHVAELNDKFEEVGESKTGLAGGLAEYSDEVLAAKDTMVDLMGDAGIDMSDALTQGLLDGYHAYLLALGKYFVLGNTTTQGSYVGGMTQMAYAEGTDRAARGVALVGEQGPELVFFAGGEQVLTAEQTRSALQSVYPVAPDLITPGAGAPAIAGHGNSQLHLTVISPVTIDGREFARATAEYVGEEMDFGVM